MLFLSKPRFDLVPVSFLARYCSCILLNCILPYVVYFVAFFMSTVCLSSNDNPEMGVLISQLLDFKIVCLNNALSPLGNQGLHATTVHQIPILELVT